MGRLSNQSLRFYGMNIAHFNIVGMGDLEPFEITPMLLDGDWTLLLLVRYVGYTKPFPCKSA